MSLAKNIRRSLAALLVLASAGTSWGQIVNANGVCCNKYGFCIAGDAVTGQNNGINNVWCGNTGGIWINGATCNPNPCPQGAGPFGMAIPIPDALGPGMPGPAATIDIPIGTHFPIGMVAAAFNVAHPRQGDISVMLTHLDTGTAVVLMDRPGYPQIMPFGFTAPDLGSSPTAGIVISETGIAPYDLGPAAAPGIPGVSSTWAPEGSLAAMHNEDAFGIWRLSVTDSTPGAAGTVSGFTLYLGHSTTTPCYANCDGSNAAPILNVADFTCFLQKYANGDPYANCDGSNVAPVINVADFTCFLQKYANGCP